jgi:SpoVK/Ycf46/Vps4 family AAA+-type ATPase
MTEQKGIFLQCNLPDSKFSDLYRRIKMPEAKKKRIIAQILLSYTIRGKVPQGALPIHGFILLVGPPGNGKTSLAKGAASVASEMLGRKSVKFIQVEPHSLTSGQMGKTQKEVHSFLTETIAEHAAQGPLIVLLDEVETLAVDRQSLSMDANPVDIHRATDAVLAALDHLAEKFPELLFIATSNFEKAVDEALLSRADAVIRIDNPDIDACHWILADTLEAMSGVWPALGKLASDPELHKVAKAAHGRDGRRIRKSVLEACASDTEVAMDPSLLTIEHLLAVFAHHPHKEKIK